MGNTQAYAKEMPAVKMPAPGVRVQTVREGDGCSYPMNGQRAKIVYEGVDEEGQLVAGTGFFPVGLGGVDRCLDSSVRSMTLGETAKVTCTPDVHYEAVSALYKRQGIPDNTREFNIHLVGIKSCNAVDGC